MKADIQKDGTIVVKAETIIEAWALNGCHPIPAEICTNCGAPHHKLILDASILLPPLESKE